MLFGSIFIRLEYVFTFPTESVFYKLQIFNLNDSDRGCFCLQLAIESVSVKLQTFKINDSDKVCDGACFYPHALGVCFW